MAPFRPRLPGLGLRSRVVAWLRVLLPLVALAMLSTLFLWSGRPDPESAIPYADVDGASLDGPPRITAPTWAGVTPDGARLLLSAASATPGGEGGQAEAMRLDWAGPGGAVARATAPHATMAEGRITLQGGVDLVLSSGWSLEADSLDAARDRSEVTASGGVAVTAPFGHLTAGEARLHRPADATEGGEVLDFTGGVRLIYQP